MSQELLGGNNHMMQFFAEAGSQPVISYWIWGFIGIFILWWSKREFIYHDPNDGKSYYYPEYILVGLIGLFLVYYWLNKIGIVPMYPWLLDHWFYGWK